VLIGDPPLPSAMFVCSSSSCRFLRFLRLCVPSVRLSGASVDVFVPEGVEGSLGGLPRVSAFGVSRVDTMLSADCDIELGDDGVLSVCMLGGVNSCFPLSAERGFPQPRMP
jgi:hypothetical protein